MDAERQDAPSVGRQAPALRARAVGTGSASASPMVGRWSPVRRSTIAVSSCSRSAMPARTSAPNAPSPAPSSRSPSARLAPIPAGVRLCARRPALGGRRRRPPARPTPEPEEPLHAARFRRERRGLPCVLARAPGLDGLVDAVGERGGPDERTAERGGEERGQHGHVAGDRARAGGDAVDAVELGVDLAQGDLRVVEQRGAALVGLADRDGGLVERAAELQQRHGQQQDEDHEGPRRDQRSDLASRHRCPPRIPTHVRK